MYTTVDEVLSQIQCNLCGVKMHDDDYQRTAHKMSHWIEDYYELQIAIGKFLHWPTPQNRKTLEILMKKDGKIGVTRKLARTTRRNGFEQK